MLAPVHCPVPAEPPPEEPIPMREPPEPDECARGYILRMAGRNWCSGKEMASWLGLLGLEQELSADPGPAARLLGITPEVLARMGFEDGEAGWVLGHRMPLNRIHRAARFVCPDCLAEAPYQRRIWSLRHLDVCPRHGRTLMSACPECDAGLRWGGQVTIENCYCGAGLAVPGATAAVDDSIGARVVYLHCGVTVPGDGLPSAFAGLPLAALLDLLVFLGRMDLIIAQGNPDRLQPREMLTDRRVLNAGARIALDWPDAFDDLADRVRAARPGRRGVMKEYGYLHRFIMRSDAKPYADLLRWAYAAHLARRGDIVGRAWPPALPRPEAQPETMGLTEVQAMLGLGRNSFNALRGQPLWTAFKPVESTLSGARNNGCEYARVDIEALKKKLSRLVSPGVADRMLGMSRGKTAELAEAGLVTVHQWHRHHRKGEHRSIDLAEVKGIFERIRGLAVAAAPARPVTFETPQRMATARRVISFIDFIRCLLCGQLRGHLTDASARGLDGLVFEQSDAEAVMDRMSSPARTGEMVLGDVVRCLGIPAKAVHQLVGEGLLPQPRRVCAYIFGVDAIQVFRKGFTYDTELARQHGTRPDDVRRTLAEAGIRPVTTIKAKRGAVVAVYRRAEVSKLH